MSNTDSVDDLILNAMDDDEEKLPMEEPDDYNEQFMDDMYDQLKKDKNSSDDTVQELIDQMYDEEEIQTNGLAHWIRGKTRRVKSIPSIQEISLKSKVAATSINNALREYVNVYPDRNDEEKFQTSLFNGREGKNIMEKIKYNVEYLKGYVQDLRLLRDDSVKFHKERVEKYKSDLKKSSEILKKIEPGPEANTNGISNWVRGKTRRVKNIDEPEKIQERVANSLLKLLEEMSTFEKLYEMNQAQERNEQISNFNGTKGQLSLERIKSYLEQIKNDVQDLEILRNDSVNNHKKRIKDYKESLKNAEETVVMDDDDLEGLEMSPLREVVTMVNMHSQMHDEHHEKHIMIERRLERIEKMLGISDEGETSDKWTSDKKLSSNVRRMFNRNLNI